jgi:hypothetical protein
MQEAVGAFLQKRPPEFGSSAGSNH